MSPGSSHSRYVTDSKIYCSHLSLALPQPMFFPHAQYALLFTALHNLTSSQGHHMCCMPKDPQTPFDSCPNSTQFIFTSHAVLILHSLRVLISCVYIPRLIDYKLFWGKDCTFNCPCFLLLRPNTGFQANTNWITHRMKTPLPLLGLLKGEKNETSVYCQDRERSIVF